MERIGDGDPYSTTAFTTTEEESTTNPRTQSPPTNIDALPDELLSEILVRNSAEDIEERVRLVCKRWCRTVHRRAFFTAHFHRHGPSSGLLLPGGAELRPTFVGATLGGKIKVSELSYDFESSSILASCNGLILAVDNFEEHSPHIVNPETETRFDLPPHTDAMRGPKRHYNRYGIAYVAASMEYKVVATYSPNQDSMDRECSILTVGVNNTWRRVATQQLSPQVNWLLLYHHPIITEGFMHWADSDENTVLTLNVETEVFAETPAPLAPPEYRVPRLEYIYHSTGTNLSVLFSCGKLSWEVWELKGESGEWSKLLPNIDMKSKIQQFGLKDDVFLIPNGWVKYPKTMLFFSGHNKECGCLIYNFDKDAMDYVKLPFTTNHVIVHEKSMVCLR